MNPAISPTPFISLSISFLSSLLSSFQFPLISLFSPSIKELLDLGFLYQRQEISQSYSHLQARIIYSPSRSSSSLQSKVTSIPQRNFHIDLAAFHRILLPYACSPWDLVVRGLDLQRSVVRGAVKRFGNLMPWILKIKLGEPCWRPKASAMYIQHRMHALFL